MQSKALHKDTTNNEEWMYFKNILDVLKVGYKKWQTDLTLKNYFLMDLY